MKNLRERWRGLTVLGVVAFAAVCMTVAPAPSFADIAGGGGGGGPITEWCSDGRPKTGLVRCEDGNLRYFDPETGAMVANSWRSLGGSWYWFGDSGAMATGWFLAGGSWYYASGSGAMATGWLSNGGTWYWLGGSGAMASNSWANVGGVWYWFDDSGAMATGWRQVGGAWYYFSGSGAMAHDAWVGDYYLQSSGAMATNAWVGSYYVGEDGKWIPGYGLVWYKSGSHVYHTHKCRTVGKDAKGYSQISIQEAQRRGASRECKNCQQIG